MKKKKEIMKSINQSTSIGRKTTSIRTSKMVKKSIKKDERRSEKDKLISGRPCASLFDLRIFLLTIWILVNVSQVQALSGGRASLFQGENRVGN